MHRILSLYNITSNIEKINNLYKDAMSELTTKHARSTFISKAKVELSISDNEIINRIFDIYENVEYSTDGKNVIEEINKTFPEFIVQKDLFNYICQTLKDDDMELFKAIYFSVNGVIVSMWNVIPGTKLYDEVRNDFECFLIELESVFFLSNLYNFDMDSYQEDFSVLHKKLLIETFPMIEDFNSLTQKLISNQKNTNGLFDFLENGNLEFLRKHITHEKILMQLKEIYESQIIKPKGVVEFAQILEGSPYLQNVENKAYKSYAKAQDTEYNLLCKIIDTLQQKNIQRYSEISEKLSPKNTSFCSYISTGSSDSSMILLS